MKKKDKNSKKYYDVKKLLCINIIRICVMMKNQQKKCVATIACY